MTYNEGMTIRYKGITIRVEKMGEFQYDGIFRWNGRDIKTDPSFDYAESPQEAINSAKDVIDKLIDFRREGIFVAEVDKPASDPISMFLSDFVDGDAAPGITIHKLHK